MRKVPLLNYSYRLFLQNNPNASRKERQSAVKKFYDFIKGEIKNENVQKPSNNEKSAKVQS